MNLYTYVANNNPSMAKAICHKYGYKISGVQNKNDLGNCLEQLVAKEGEPALKDIVFNHPDRDIIIEFNERDKGETKLNHQGEHHNCPRCGRSQSSCICQKQYANYMNYIGEDNQPKPSSQNINVVSQTNTFLLASAFLLGVAIISRK